jgi:tetratricopeptide (TPR) repeat protein
LINHPALSVLRRFLSGDLSLDETRAVVSHLVRGCKQCLERIAPDAATFFQLAEPEPAVAELPGDSYELPIRRAIEAVRLHGAEAPKIKAATRKVHQRMVAKGWESVSLKHFPDYAVFEALLQRVQDLRHENPQQMVRYAQIAVWTARLMKECPPEQQADLHARALVEYANALRVADQLHQAGQQLDLADQWYVAGTQDVVLGLRLQDIRASLYGAQEHYADAIALLDEVGRGRLLIGDRTGAARASIKKGVVTAYAGRLSESFGHFDAALALIDSGSEAGLQEMILHNKIFFMASAGLFGQAFDLLEKHRLSLWEWGGRMSRCRLLDIEGRIHAGLGHLDLSEILFRQSMEGFKEAGVQGHEALAALDLATVILRQSRSRYHEAVTLAVEALRTFTQLRVKPHVVEALNVLADVIQQGLVTATLLQSVADFVRKAEYDRRARYQPRFE